MSEDGGEITGGGEQQRPSSAVLRSPLEDDNLLSVILCRLPSVPPSLLRASLVNKPWHKVVSDSRFQRDFRAHHKKPPLLGFFSDNFLGKHIQFTTVLDPPDCVPAARFTRRTSPVSMVLRSHHGRVLVVNQQQRHFLVWDPVTNEQLTVAFPPALDGTMIWVIDGGVVCAATEEGHVHGACHSDPFKLVFVGADWDNVVACAYSSETREWGNLFSVMLPPHSVRFSPKAPSTLFGNSICMLLCGEKAVIVEFDWGRGSLALIDVPSDAYELGSFRGGSMGQFMITPAGTDDLNFCLLSTLSIIVWKRVFDCVGVARWVLGDTIELGNLLSLEPTMSLDVLAVDEDNNVILRLTDEDVFTVNLESMEFKKLSIKLPFFSFYFHPFKSFCTPGMRISAGHDDDVITTPGA